MTDRAQSPAGQLRPYRLKAMVMGQTSPPGLQYEVVNRVVGSSVADVGCGSGVTGYLLRAAWQFTDSWLREQIIAPERLVGIDWSDRTIEALRRCNPYDEVLLAGSTGVPLPDDAVDTAVSIENLEHLLPGEVAPALAELARITRRKILLSTPAPWAVNNIEFLSVELPQAVADPDPMSYAEFMTLVGWLHKSTVTPEQMRAAGFSFAVNRLGAPSISYGSVVYSGDPEEVDVGKLGLVTGVAMSDYPRDDGSHDWRARYVEVVRSSLAMETPMTPPAIRRVSAVAKAVRDAWASD